MILIYSDNQIIDLEWVPNLGLQNFEVVHSVEEFETKHADVKIAFIGHRLHEQYDIELGFNEKVRRTSAVSIAVFCLESELHNAHWRETFSPNNYWIVPGFVNDEKMSPHLLFWGDWFKTSALLYKALPNKLGLLTPYKTKPKIFDALLGVVKPHRTFVANAVKEHQLEDKFILTYGGNWANDQFYAKDYFIWEPECVPLDNIIGTADWVKYHGYNAHLSQIIPIDVYNDTAYSIIAETDHDNTLSFFSEKTAKALIARRVFVAFSGYRFLHNLRKVGVQTFGDIIDESYDEIFNDNERYTAAFEQVRKLCDMDQQEVLEKARPVLEHNFKLIMTANWTQLAIDQIKEVIDRLNVH